MLDGAWGAGAAEDWSEASGAPEPAEDVVVGGAWAAGDDPDNPWVSAEPEPAGYEPRAESVTRGSGPAGLESDAAGASGRSDPYEPLVRFASLRP